MVGRCKQSGVDGAAWLRTQQGRGFTLIEVLVALAVVAIALLAAGQAGSALLRAASRQQDMLLAQICAENQLVALRLARTMPAVGESDAPCPQAGRQLTVRTIVMPTPNPNFVRVDAQTLDGETPLLRLSTIMGRF